MASAKRFSSRLGRDLADHAWVSDKKSVESLRLGASLKSEAERRAQADGISASEVIRRALEHYLRSASLSGLG